MAGKKKIDQQAPSGFVPATAQNSKKAGQAMSSGVGEPMGMASQYSRSNPNYQNRKKGTPKGKIAAIVVLVVVLVGGLAGGGFYLYKEMQKSNINENLHSMSEDQMQAVDAELTGTTSFEEPFTVLLLGSDARADDPDMGARTDTIIVVRVDPVENIVSMVSIPRDTFIEIDGVGPQKFNAAFTYGGESGTIAAVKKLTGVSIDHFAEVNFESLVGLVDAIGGIDVEVEEEIDDEDAGGHIDAGKQHLDGEHALIFARSRHYVDGDYTRQVNQRKVILAIVDRALTAPATELTGLIQASTKFVTTDSGIDFDFIYSLADQMRHNEKPITINSATIPSSTANINEVSYVVADTAGVKEMMGIFMKGGDVSKGVTASSISEDIAKAKKAAGASSSESESPESENANATSEAQTQYDPSQYEQSYETTDDSGQVNYTGTDSAQTGDTATIQPSTDEGTATDDAAATGDNGGATTDGGGTANSGGAEATGGGDSGYVATIE